VNTTADHTITQVQVMIKKLTAEAI